MCTAACDRAQHGQGYPGRCATQCGAQDCEGLRVPIATGPDVLPQLALVPAGDMLTGTHDKFYLANGFSMLMQQTAGLAQPDILSASAGDM